ncbi:type II toxin-antitoxin system ParD family antitoxin [Novosphingobium sediminicola]|uniref:Antitoxin ParD1/3/4 n=1 Tax=Novosphingobium sediminicola TaxID=563162 RepID=A0A7W6G884_9SPHN|nr:type II toxin-antitoxin system ParD family antitoxin [Novosphingobium sediminicola]MBB3957699.1 antitoxin ParD1/3/4 [Novosphingobium sediminicola]
MPSGFTLGAHFEGLIKQQVNSGRYASTSEVVCHSLRPLEEQEAMRQARLDALRSEVESGVRSGPGIPADRVFTKARQRITDIAAEHLED